MDAEHFQLNALTMSLDEIIEAQKNQGAVRNQHAQRFQRRGGQYKSVRRVIARKPYQKFAIRRFKPMKASTTRIGISNLSFDVDDIDLQTLFKECGPIKESSVYYDQKGDSLGMAEVVYKTQRAASTAVSCFNNVRLDGRKMHVHQLPEKRNVCLACFYSKRNNYGNERAKLREQLDKELDEYVERFMDLNKNSASPMTL
ncbi:aly/REF export factor 2-like [Teleopsis dalmanni]|uniref:aly/REF export factor 2-like n=1 Tax=Teleopsis dalmanni TaxID=139649 RepID=UPI0018CD0D36|nr:aly/REF export factor 2-like [Teleopsis dalmanni]XP_037927219.1 aly/REF export factor 2-like [Teleopsis dalmanni]